MNRPHLPASCGRRLRSAFMRGGTSKGLMFLEADLPAERAVRDQIFLAAMGSPDPHGRQLDGMGGGVSSLSKVCIVGPSGHPGADVDYTFAQVQIGRASVNYAINCGNMSSAIGPFALARGLVRAGADGSQTVRIFNTNTGKVIHAHFPLENGQAQERGDLAIPGVAGTGAPIRLDFLDPGGAATGALLPGKGVAQHLDIPGLGEVQVSLLDAANACVFISPHAVGLRGDELPDEIAANIQAMEKLERIRAHAAVEMGLAATVPQAHANPAAPFIVMVAPPATAPTLAGTPLPASASDLTVRALSNGQPHRALPLTVALCTAIAAQLEGSIVHRATRRLSQAAPASPLRLGMPSGVLQVDALVSCRDSRWQAERGSFFRTARRLFDGYVYY